MQPVEIFALWKFGRYDLETLKNLNEAFDDLEEARKAKAFQLAEPLWSSRLPRIVARS